MKIKEKLEQNGFSNGGFLDGYVPIISCTFDEIVNESFDTAFWDGDPGTPIICVRKIKDNEMNDDVDERRIFCMTEEAWDRMCSSQILKNNAIDLAKKYQKRKGTE